MRVHVAVAVMILAGGCSDGGGGASDAEPSSDASSDAATDAPPGTPVTPIFFSDWRTADLGTSNALVRDGGKWDIISGTDRGEVIDAPAGFPTSRALLVEYKNGGFVILRKTGLPVPAIGATRNYRWYYRHDQRNWPQDNTQHPIQDGNAQGDISWGFNTEALTDTTWRVYFGVQVNSGENTFQNGRWYTPTLTTGTVYRFELQVHRTAATQFQLHARIFDAGGALLHDENAFTNTPAGGTSSLADNPTFTFNQDMARPYHNADTLNGLNAGCNGVTGVTEVGFDYAVQAAYAVVDGLAPGAVIGPYGAVVGEQP